MDVVQSRSCFCRKTTRCLFRLCLKYGRTFVVRFWSGIVVKKTVVRLKRKFVMVTAVFTPSVYDCGIQGKEIPVSV
ncbi:hypothetical protein DPMN_122478 [Dreissena polymorpha]|uniref:Uncharacterized protein n=1 Tax=Dreissena polymorpha TaxID=45954 RepID=A0A9D4JS20_DREPO|nr:hypothetical protein DPMN_122478 [Dreissena polymorpha]